MSALPAFRATSAAPFEFVPMREADLDAVAAAERASYEFPWTRGNFLDSFAAGHGMWLARAEGRLAGYAIYMMAVDEAHLLDITVLPEFRRRGLGRALLAHVCELVRGHGAERMLLEVRAGNAAALALYGNCGFARIGLRKGYYPAPAGREDAIVMAKPL